MADNDSPRAPSTGDAQQAPDTVPDDVPGGPDRARDARADTRANVNGEPAPRLPHERDESSDSGTGAPSDVMRRAGNDVESGKSATDKSEATDEVYRRSLRERTPGAERD
jgi:hypothetical protein